MITTFTNQTEDIQQLLEMSMIQWEPHQIQAWMQHQYDPYHLYGYWQKEHLISMIQTIPTKIQLGDHMVSALGIEWACTHPNHRQHGHFKALLKVVLEQSHYNHVLTYCITDFPQLLENRRFQAVAYGKVAWIESPNKGNPKRVSTTFHDSYDIYTEFMDHFEGTPLFDHEQYLAYLRYQMAKKKQVVTTNKGVAIVSNHSIDTIWYIDSSAIDDILAYLNEKNLRIHTSASEHLEKYYTLHHPRKTKTLLVRLNDPKLYARASHAPLKSIQTIYQQLSHPVWTR
jgi:hypothetical protein